MSPLFSVFRRIITDPAGCSHQCTGPKWLISLRRQGIMALSGHRHWARMESLFKSEQKSRNIHWQKVSTVAIEENQVLMTDPQGRTHNWTRVHWPVGDAYTWHDSTIGRLGLQRYRLYEDKSALIYKYVLEFTINTSSVMDTWYFQDETEDAYHIVTFVSGDHYFRYNSDRPTIIKADHFSLSQVWVTLGAFLTHASYKYLHLFRNQFSLVYVPPPVVPYFSRSLSPGFTFSVSFVSSQLLYSVYASGLLPLALLTVQ